MVQPLSMDNVHDLPLKSTHQLGEDPEYVS